MRIRRFSIFRADKTDTLVGNEPCVARANERQLTRGQIVEAAKARRPPYGANLSGANLQGADLQGADLRAAILSGADM